MKRHLCTTALLALVLVPDWASACWPRRGGPVATRTYYAPVYQRPIYYAAAPVYCQPVYVVPAGPAPVQPMQPPRVEQPKGKAGSSLTEPGRPIAKPTPAPADADPVRPVGGIEKPKPQPAPEPRAKPPAAEDKFPPLEFPKPGGTDAKLPPIELPKVNVDPKLPPLELPKVNVDPKVPALELPGTGGPAVPVPAPAPDLIPAPAIPVPKTDGLPPLTLPPDTPVAPAVALPKVVESKSSPLAAVPRELKVSVFAAAGTGAAQGLRKIGFYNHTDRDLALTIEGKQVTLPAMSYLHAQMPPTFTWKCGDRPAATERVPADATGLDVLIRE